MRLETTIPLQDGLSMFVDRDVDQFYARLGSYEVYVVGDELRVGPFTSTGRHGYTQERMLLRVPLTPPSGEDLIPAREREA